jgi:sn-glycerol 3-phosphate transport system substrate-binding protein
MKRALAVVLLGTLALGLAACGDSSSPTDEAQVTGTGGDCPLVQLAAADAPVEVTVWHSLIAESEAALQDIVDGYNASQSTVQVVLESKGESYAEVQQAYDDAVAADDPAALPAIVLLEEDQTRAMADAGGVVPASACIAEGGDHPDWLLSAESYFTIDGTTWPSAFNLSVPILYFNRSHFEDAGLDPTTPPQTLDELRAAAEAIQDAGVPGVDAPLILILQSWFVETWLTGIEQTVVDADNGRSGTPTEATLDTPEALELFTWIDQMEEDGLLLPVPATDGQLDQYLAMADESGSMLIETSTAATSVEAFLQGELDPSQISDDRVVVEGLDDLDLGLDVSVAPLPGIELPGRSQVGGGAYFLVDGEDAQVAAGWDFLEHLNTVPAQVEMNLQGSYLPSLRGVAGEPELAEVWTSTLSGRWLSTAYTQLTDGVLPDFPGPSIGPYDEFRAAVSTALDAMVIDDSLTPEQALAQAQEQVTEALVDHGSG